MSVDFTPREVLEYLNELGYYNITTRQLKEFMKDLKKLIKYESSQQAEQKENIQPLKPDPFESLYSTSTVSSRAKIVNKNEKNDKIVKIQIVRAKNHQRPASCTYLTKPDSSDTKLSAQQTAKVEERLLKEASGSKTKLQSKSEISSRPQSSSVILPAITQPNRRNDPVKLYHQYKAEWEKQKLPGESSHADIRWSVREKMMGGPSITSLTRRK